MRVVVNMKKNLHLIGAVLIGIGTLIAYWQEYKEILEQEIIEFKKYKNLTKKIYKNMADAKRRQE